MLHRMLSLSGSAMAVFLALMAFHASVQRAEAAPFICLEQVSNISGLWMQSRPSNPDEMVIAVQTGTIYIATLPKPLSNVTSEILYTFLNLTDRVLLGPPESGLLSFAFHPEYTTNGRFFVSYICSSKDHPDCKGPCACSPELGCQGPANCTDQTVVAEYLVQGDPPSADVPPKEVRKIFNFGRPSASRNGGQIWFGPDGYLYFSSGDGGIPDGEGTQGGKADPFQTAQNGRVPLGKILRVDVDGDTLKNNTWGTYNIPTDNPFVGIPNVTEEVYALGLRNPWRCSYDVQSSSLICGDVGESKQEEVNVVTAGGNYGWSVMEGTGMNTDHPLSLNPKSPLGGNYTKPVLEYPHPADPGQFRAVVGGYVYRATSDPCLQGQYVFGDQSGLAFVGTFPPLNATATSEQATYAVGLGQNLSSVEFLFSWATDSNAELYRLSSSGVYRVVNSSACGQECASLIQLPSSSPPSSDSRPSWSLPSGLAALATTVATLITLSAV